MRIIFSTLFCIVLFTFYSCKKDKQASSPPLFGKWKWEYSNSVNGGDTLRPKAGSVVELRLNGDSSYSLVLNTVTVSTGSYTTSFQSSNNKYFINFTDYLDTDNLYVNPQKVYTLNSTDFKLYDDPAPDDLNIISEMHFVKTP